MKQTKILVVVSSLNVGGTENHIYQVFPKLNSAEYRVAVYTTNQPGVMAKKLQKKGIKIYSSKLSAMFHRMGKIGKLLAYAATILRLTWLNLVYRPDIVHCFLPGPFILGGFCARLTRRPYLIMSRRGMNYYQKRYPRLAKSEAALIKKTDRILANSKRVYDQLLHEENVPEDKLRLIYNGIEIAKYHKEIDSEQLKKTLRISDDAVVMTIVANLYAYKGHIDLLKALVSIKDNLPINWVLLCVGRDEGCLQGLCEYAAKNQITSHIHWLDQRHDVPELLAISDIGILCSHEEGFSNSVIEGMAAGLPMVVTDVGGNAEAVKDDETGYVVPSKSPGLLAKAILSMTHDASLRKKMGQAGFDRVKELFSLARCVDGYRSVYDELGFCESQHDKIVTKPE